MNILANQLTVTNGLYTGLGYFFTTIAGTVGSSAFADGTNEAAWFDTPVGTCVDANGNLYIADTGNSVIRKLTPITNGWVSSTIAGLAGYPGNTDGTNSQARFDYPSGVAVDTNGNLYVADQVNSTVRKITTDGTNWTTASTAATSGTAATSSDADESIVPESMPLTTPLSGGLPPPSAASFTCRKAGRRIGRVARGPACRKPSVLPPSP